jgi:hypothetical protein
MKINPEGLKKLFSIIGALRRNLPCRAVDAALYSLSNGTSPHVG